jgi:transcriptional regulator with XRE-family HTH domain
MPMARGEAARFGHRLRKLREQAGLTQGGLAERSGMHRQGIAKLEGGEREPSWGTVLALAGALGVTCEAFNQEPATLPESRPATSEAPATPKKRGRPKKQP